MAIAQEIIADITKFMLNADDERRKDWEGCAACFHDELVAYLTVKYESDAESKDLIDPIKSQMIDVEKIRTAVADYMQTEGCSCCRGVDHEKNQGVIGEMLGVERYDDDSGWNFSIYKTDKDPI